MYLKRLLAFLCCFTLVFCLFPSSAFATGGNGNIDGGGGSMGHGTSSNFWNSGNDGVRITVVDASSGTAVSSPLDFSNRTQKTNLLHFGKVNKLQYLGGAGLSLQSGVAYSCIRPTQSMPTIVSSKGQSNIEAIKRYFCSEYACMMVAQAAGVDYERMIAGEYKLLIEPIAYFTHNGQYYCMTATEAGLYDQMSGGNLRKTMTSLTHKNLPLSMFLEFSDLGISAWTGSTTGKQNNSDIISTLGVGIVWFDEAPPEGEIEAPDVEYRVDTDVITAVTLRTDQDLTPDNPASVTFHILGTTYRVNDIVIPAGDSQVVWVKWHTPSTPQTVTITVSVSGAYTAQDSESDIQEAYGWEFISERQYERYLELFRQGRKALDEHSPTVTELALSILNRIFQDIDRDCRQCEFEALSPEEQLAELKRAEESRQAWKQYIASLKEMVGSMTGKTNDHTESKNVATIHKEDAK